MTPTAPLSKTTRSKGLSGGQTGLGFTENIEQAFQQSTNGRVRAKIVPGRILDVSHYAEVVVPTAGGTNIANKQTFVEADLTRNALEFLMEDTGLDEIEVLGPAQTDGSPTNGENGGTTEAGFFQRNLAWILGGGAVVIVGAQLLARGGRRRLEEPNQEQGRSNPNGTIGGAQDEIEDLQDDFEEEAADDISAEEAERAAETLQESVEEASAEVAGAVDTGERTADELERETEESLPESLKDRGNPNSESGSSASADFWIARSTVDKDEMDRGNVHRTSMAANIASLDIADQRRIASNLAVAPGGEVTVWKNTSEGLKEQKTFTWNAESGFSPTS